MTIITWVGCHWMCCLLNLGSTNRTGTIFIRHVLDSQMSSFFCCGEGKWTEGIIKGLCSTSTIILIMQKYWPVLMQQLYCLGLYLVITTLRCRPTHYFSTPSSTRSTSIKFFLHDIIWYNDIIQNMMLPWPTALYWFNRFKHPSFKKNHG